ncbi:MAG TPA: SPASM domain-containing protein [Thermodesulfobacteriota bacterium]
MKVFGLSARKPFPTKVTVDLNTQCNAKCIICPYPEISASLKHGRMEWGLYKRIIDDYAAICLSNGIMGELSYCNMSEPTLLPDFPEFVKYAREKGVFTIYFNSNGSNLGPALVDRFIKDRTYPAVHLNIMAFSEGRYREVMGLDFSRLRENLGYLLKKYPHKLIDIGFFTPLMTGDEIGAVKEFFRGTKVKLHLAEGISDRASNVTLPEGLRATQHEQGRRLVACGKNRPIHRMHVNYDGRVYLCDQDMRLETDFGNVSVSTIEEVWNGKAMTDALDALYGRSAASGAELPCLRCEDAVYDGAARIHDSPSDFRPRRLFGPLKRWAVRKGYCVVMKRGKISFP